MYRRLNFNRYCTSEGQKKWEPVQHVIKKLKNTKARSPHPAWLKLFSEPGAKTFKALTGCASGLEEMGIHIQEDETAKPRKSPILRRGENEEGRLPKMEDTGILTLIQEFSVQINCLCSQEGH